MMRRIQTITLVVYSLLVWLFSAQADVLSEQQASRREASRFALGTPVKLTGHRAPIRALGFTPQGKHIISSTLDDDTFFLWDTVSGKPPNSTKGDRLVERYWLASVGRTWPLLCDVRTGKDVRLFRIPKLAQTKMPFSIVSCSADGKWLLRMTRERNRKVVLDVINCRSSQPVRSFTCAGDAISAALSPDGKTMAAASRNNKIWFIDVISGLTQQYHFQPPTEVPTLPFSCLKFSPDSSRIAIVGLDGVVRVLAVRGGRLLAEIQETDISIGGVGPVVCDVSFSPDGRTLAIGKPVGFFSVWEVSSGQLVRQQKGDSFLFSPDNRTSALLSGNSLRVYDLYAGYLLGEYKSCGGPLSNLVFSPDARLMAASCDSAVLAWHTLCPTAGATSPVDQRKVEQLWKELEGDETIEPSVENWKASPTSSWRDMEEGGASRVYKAIGQLAADPNRSIPFLKQRLREDPTPDGRVLRRLIAGLDSTKFRKREAAARQLANFGAAARAAMRAALAKGPSPEARIRLERLLREAEQKQQRLLRARMRAVQALECIGTTDAQQVLANWASAGRTDLSTCDARRALERIQTRNFHIP